MTHGETEPDALKRWLAIQCGRWWKRWWWLVAVLGLVALFHYALYIPGPAGRWLMCLPPDLWIDPGFWFNAPHWLLMLHGSAAGWLVPLQPHIQNLLAALCIIIPAIAAGHAHVPEDIVLACGGDRIWKQLAVSIRKAIWTTVSICLLLPVIVSLAPPSWLFRMRQEVLAWPVVLIAFFAWTMILVLSIELTVLALVRCVTLRGRILGVLGAAGYFIILRYLFTWLSAREWDRTRVMTQLNLDPVWIVLTWLLLTGIVSLVLSAVVAEVAARPAQTLKHNPNVR